MIMWIAIVIIVILMCLDKGEQSKKNELDNQIVGYNTMNGHPIRRKDVNITGYDTRTGQPLFEYKKPIIAYNTYTGDPIFEGEEIPNIQKPKQPMTEEEKTRLSSTILMITGAILVVIASIIFLATGWDTMNGLLKTLILFAIQMIFYLFSYISNNKLNIPKIGKMFTYLTLAFVPIIILSLSFFEIVGDFLSVGGEGFPYYIGISLIISDIIYKFYGKSKQDTFVKRTSLIVEAIAIIFLLSKIELMHIEIFGMIIHTIIIYMLLQGGFLDKEAYSKENLYYSLILLVISALSSFEAVSIMSFTNLLILALSYFIRCLDANKESEKKQLLIYFFVGYLLSIRIIEQLSMSPYFLYLLSLLPILALTKVVNTETMKKNIVNVVGILTIAITAYSILDAEQTIFFLLTYIIGFILLALVYKFNNKSIYKLWSYLNFSAIFFSICYVTNVEGVAEYILLIMPILVYAIEYLYEGLKDNTSYIFIIGCLCFEVLTFTETYTMIIPLVLLTIYILLENKKNLLIIPMLLSLLLCSLEDTTIVSIIFGLLSIIYVIQSVNKEGFNRYTVFSVITLLILCSELEANAYVIWGLLLIWGIIQYLFKQKDNNEIYLSTIVFSLFGLYTKSLIDVDTELFANYALGIILVVIAMTKGVLRKIKDPAIGFIECGSIALLTIIGSLTISEPIDGVAYLGILLVLSILSYVKNWKTYLYTSVVSMVFGVIVLTAEYWQEIPWYVYILVIGLILIIFAMYDEKRKQNKKIEHTNQMIHNIEPTFTNPVQTIEPVTRPQLVKEPVLVQTIEKTPNIVEELPKEEIPTEETNATRNQIPQEKEVELPNIKIVEDTSSKQIVKKAVNKNNTNKTKKVQKSIKQNYNRTNNQKQNHRR